LSLKPDSRAARNEDVEAAETLEIFREVADGLDEYQLDEFRELAEDLTYSRGNTSGLRDRLSEIKNQNFVDARVFPYLTAIDLAHYNEDEAEPMHRQCAVAHTTISCC
jgi:hypothetical protein